MKGRATAANFYRQCVPEAAVLACMGTMAASAPLTLHAAEMVIGTAGHKPVDHDVGAADTPIRACFAGDHHADSGRAIMEKRAPSFRRR